MMMKSLGWVIEKLKVSVKDVCIWLVLGHDEDDFDSPTLLVWIKSLEFSNLEDFKTQIETNLLSEANLSDSIKALHKKQIKLG